MCATGALQRYVMSLLRATDLWGDPSAPTTDGREMDSIFFVASCGIAQKELRNKWRCIRQYAHLHL